MTGGSFHWPLAGADARRTRDAVLTWGALAVLVLLAVLHVYVVLRHAVDIPYWDEWDTIQGIGRWPGLHWFLARHNEHRIVFTQVEYWLLYLANGLDFRYGVAVNLILYGLLVWQLWVLCRLVAPEVPKWVLLAFFWFLMSAVISSNLIWPFQSQWHIPLLCLATAYPLVLGKRPGPGALTAYGALLVLSTYSISLGLVGAVVTALWVLTHAWCAPPEQVAPVTQPEASDAVPIAAVRRRRPWGLLAVTAVVLVLAALWFTGFHHEAGHPAFLLPYHPGFWRWLCALVAAAFGLRHHSEWVGLVIVIVLLVPPGLKLLDPETRWNRGVWVQLGFTLSVLAMMATITAGRAGFGMAQTAAPRYAELGIVLLPLLVINLWRLTMRFQPETRGVLRAFIWFAVFLGLQSHFTDAPYKFWHERNVETVRCVAAHLNAPPAAAVCPSGYPVALGYRLTTVERDQFHFVRTIRDGTHAGLRH